MSTQATRRPIRVFVWALRQNPHLIFPLIGCTARCPIAQRGKAKLKAAIEETRDILGVPESYKIGIVPASDTGAVEMAMWSLLGARKTMVAWESFGAGWVTDVIKQLKLDAEVLTLTTVTSWTCAAWITTPMWYLHGTGPLQGANAKGI